MPASRRSDGVGPRTAQPGHIIISRPGGKAAGIGAGCDIEKVVAVALPSK